MSRPKMYIHEFVDMSGWNAWAQLVLSRKQDGVVQPCAHHGGLFGLDGKLWAGTSSFITKEVKAHSIKKVHDAIAKGAEAVSKLEFGDKKFLVLNNDSTANFVIGKSLERGAGCTIAKANSCFIVGIYDNDEIQPANNTNQVVNVRDQLMTAGY